MVEWKLVLLTVCACMAQGRAQISATAAASAGWEVSGTIKGQAGPLKGAWVTIVGPELIRPTKTDSEGRYTFKGSVGGTYSIRVEKPDDASEPRSRTVTLINGRKLDRIDLLVPKGAVITGRVADRAGRPISGLPVIAYQKSYEQGPLRLFERGGALTDDAGAYRIRHLTEGVYVISAVSTMRKPLSVGRQRAEPESPIAPAYPPVTFAPSGRTLAGAAAIEAGDGEERPGVDITVQKEPVYCVFFRPVTAYSGPNEDLRIGVDVTEWIGTRGPKVAAGNTRPGQDTEVCGLPQGEYRIGLLSYFRQPLKGVGYGQATAVISNQHVSLGSVNVGGLEDLNGTVTIAGANAGEPVPDGIRVMLILRNRSMLPNDTLIAPVQASGSFTLPRVYPDSYGIRLENLPAGHYVERIHQNGLDAQTTGIRPDAGDVRIDLASDGPTISGRVTTEAAQPVPEVTVFLIKNDGGEILTTQSDQSGAYSFSSGVMPGEYRVIAVQHLPESQRRDGQVAASLPASGTDVKLEPRDRKTFNLIVSELQ